MSKWFVAPVVAGLAAVLCGGPALAQADAQAIIKKGIEAYGGKDKIAKMDSFRAKSKGTIEIMGMTLKLSQEMAFQAPGMIRDQMQMDVMGNNVNVVTLFDGEKAQIVVNGMNQPVNDQIVSEFKDATYAMRVARLVELGNKEFKVETIGDSKIDDREVVGVRVTSQGRRDVALYFDKKTGAIAKIEKRVVDSMTGQEVNEERIIDEYKDIDGLKMVKKMRILRDGKKFLEMEVEEVKLTDKIDKSEFQKP